MFSIAMDKVYILSKSSLLRNVPVDDGTLLLEWGGSDGFISLTFSVTYFLKLYFSFDHL